MSPSASTRHQLLVTRHSGSAANPPFKILNPNQVASPKMSMCGTSLKKRCQEDILLVSFDEIDAKYQWVSLGVWEVHFQA
jgi:hypothetical protein